MRKSWRDEKKSIPLYFLFSVVREMGCDPRGLQDGARAEVSRNWIDTSKAHYVARIK